jgi:hypothetical protein
MTAAESGAGAPAEHEHEYELGQDAAGQAALPAARALPSAAPEQSREDTDAAWGEYPESADDRLYRDRPPHWDNS